jgi:hypothetical protein
VIRIGGTLLGLIMAILIWYIGRHSTAIRRALCYSPSGPGNGGGNGNPYGLAASYAVLIVPVLFVRLFAPPQLLPGAILGTVRNLMSLSLCPPHPALGYSVAHHRILMDRWSPTSIF